MEESIQAHLEGQRIRKNCCQAVAPLHVLAEHGLLEAGRIVLFMVAEDSESENNDTTKTTLRAAEVCPESQDYTVPGALNHSLRVPGRMWPVRYCHL